jgi:uncharacterized 2Fe-2S/4Fe-4S cluster protein (DUF4445 family)
MSKLLKDNPVKLSLALDLGTTTLSGRLFAGSGEVLADYQIANPQREEGADILMRLQRAHEGAGGKLQDLIVEGLRVLIKKLLSLSGGSAPDVGSVVAAGNPGMSCLLQGLPVSSLLFPPHKPPCRELTFLPVEEVDIGMTEALHLFPLVSGFVGGDLVACLLALPEVQPGTLLIDVGTNAELSLWDGTNWLVTSAAAGPAFEGGNVGSGMIMAEGAVTDVSLAGDRMQLSVAGGGPPRGLCGSGLAALVAAARQGGLIDVTGRIRSAAEVETNLSRYLVERQGSWAIRFYHDAHGELLLHQDDLRNFQLAKGAVRAGTEVLLDRGGFTPEGVSQVLVTGALGTALPIEVLKRVALLPEAMLDKTSFIANGVLAGLQAYLTATDGQQRLAELTNSMQAFPLSGTPAFERLFLTSLEF